MLMTNELGRLGESLAASFLEGSGWVILERNWRCRDGEVDLVARDRGDLVFVEVKTRSGDGFGHPLEAVTPVKLARLRRLARAWCRENGEFGPIRIDVVAILTSGGGGPRVEHLRGVF